LAGISGACWAFSIQSSLGQTSSGTDQNSATTSRRDATQSQSQNYGGDETRQSSSGQSNNSQSNGQNYSSQSRSGQADRGTDYRSQRSGQNAYRDAQEEAREHDRASGSNTGNQSNQRQSDDRRSDRDSSSRYGSETNHYGREYGSRDDSGRENRNQRDYSRDSSSRDDERARRSSSRDQQTNRDENSNRDQYSDGRNDSDGRNSREDRNDQSSRENQGQYGRGQTGRQTQVSRAADIGLWFNRNTNNGLVISDVASSGAISRAGFREGDHIVSINGARVSSEQQFLNALMSPQIQNQRVQILVWRNSQQVPLWIEPWAVLHTASSSQEQSNALEQLGLVMDDRYQFPVVWRVTPRSPAYYAGIRTNDVIVTWNGQHVRHPQDLDQVAEQTEASEIPVQISRNRQLRQVVLETDGQTRTALRPNYDQEQYDNRGTNQNGYQQGQGAYQQGAYQQGQQPGVQQGYYQQGNNQQGTGQQGTYQQNMNQGPGLFPRLRGR
jgi:C-terminal processing protease CtpA/Prc